MAEELGAPIWVHPAEAARKLSRLPDWRKKSKYEMWWVFGWPYETSIFMARIIFAGYFDRFPKLKIITHHLGGMVPYFSGTHGLRSRSAGRAHRRGRSHGLFAAPEKAPARIFQRCFTPIPRRLARAPHCAAASNYFGVDQVLFASGLALSTIRKKGAGYIRESHSLRRRAGDSRGRPPQNLRGQRAPHASPEAARMTTLDALSIRG